MQDEVERIEIDYGEQSFNKTFGDRVRQARNELEWSQRKLAETLDGLGVKLDPSAVTRIERGTREAKLREATAIAAALGIPLQDLAPNASASPREQFDSCLQLASRHGGEARVSLANTAMYISAAMHLIDHHPELLNELGVQTTSELFDSLNEAIAKTVADSPAAYANDEWQARSLKAAIEAMVQNLIGIRTDEAEADGSDT